MQTMYKKQHYTEQDEENAERMWSRVNKYIKLQEVPSPSNCPIFNGNGMCMCASMACDDVKDFHCASMRFAFAYGYNTMAQRANEWRNGKQILKEAGEYADNPILNNAT